MTDTTPQPAPEPRALTAEEMRQKFLEHLMGLAAYWASPHIIKTSGPQISDTQDRIEGFIFSLLVTFDGGTMTMPGFSLVPHVPDEDIAFHKEQGENWFDPNTALDETEEGSFTQLHDAWSALMRARDEQPVKTGA